MNNKELPAYPVGKQETTHSPRGLTKLEAFTLAAMQGLLANRVMGDADLHPSGKDWVEDITESALEFAEAQLDLIEKNKARRNESES